MSIKFNKVGYVYSPKSPFTYVALKNIDLNIKQNSFSAVIGQTGSGKSTLIQHLNALMTPTSGTIEIFDKIIYSDRKNKNLKNLRSKIGVVFQFPEYQLFEETVLKDIIFGPLNFKVSKIDAIERAKKALKAVSLDESFLEKSPFELSGGEKRRVAIAGILAIEPDVLVLDEPTSGLDTKSAKEIMLLFDRLHKVEKKTIILVSHDMDIVYEYASDVIVLKNGQIAFQGPATTLFNNAELLQEIKIQPPQIVDLINKIKKNGLHIDDTYVRNDKQLAKALFEGIKK